MSETVLEFKVKVYHWNIYGDKLVEKTMATIIADDVNDLTTKMRKIFNAQYDDFRDFWSYTCEVIEVTESLAHGKSATKIL